MITKGDFESIIGVEVQASVGALVVVISVEALAPEKAMKEMEMW